MALEFTGERIVPGAENCEPLFADKMYMEHSARYKLASKFAKGAKILDIGCGVGYGSAILADAGAESVTAFDLSAEAIEHARTFYARPTISFETGDATAFSYEDKFDLIVCFELIEHVPNPDKTFECIMSCLAEDGILVMSTRGRLKRKETIFIFTNSLLTSSRTSFVLSSATRGFFSRTIIWVRSSLTSFPVFWSNQVSCILPSI